MTRFKAVKDGTKDEWIEGLLVLIRFGRAFGIQQRLPDERHLVVNEIDPSTLHQEIGGEWYTMEELRENLLDAGINKAQMHRNNELHEENVLIKAKNDKLNDKLMVQGVVIDKRETEITQLKEEVERLKDPKEYRVEFGNHLACGINVNQGVLTVTGAIDGWGNGVPSDEISIKLNP